MDAIHTIEKQWIYVRSFLPSVEAVENSAREMGVIQRKRVIRSAEVLLRMILAYAATSLSLRGVAAWARLQKLADISDVGLLKKFKKASKWLGHLLNLKLAECVSPPKNDLNGMKLRLVDATSISEHGSKGTDWRIHLGYDLTNNTIDQIELTDVKGGETLTRFHIGPGELVIGDRGYSNRQGLKSVIDTGGDFLIRLNWSTVPLQTLDGQNFDLIGALRSLKDGKAGDFPVQTVPVEKKDLPAIRGRLIAIRKTEQSAKASREKVKKAYRKKRKQPDSRTIETAGYVFLFTSLDRDKASAEELLDLYRFRWQIELVFKRMKGLLKLGDLPAKDPELVRTYLYAKLLLALILQDLTEVYLGFSPWGFRFP